MGRAWVSRSLRVGVAFIVSLLAFGAIAPQFASATAGVRAKTAQACEKEVAFQLIDATTSGCLTQTSPGVWTSTDTVSINGLSIPSLPGTQLILTGPTAASPGGQLSVKANISVAGVTFDKGLSVNLPAGGKGDEKNVVSTSTPNGQKLFGFDIKGSVEIRIGWDATNNLHYVKFIGNLELPSIFKNGPEKGAGGLTATVALRVDPAGVHADAVKAQITNAWIGPLQVKNLCLSYLGAGSTSTTPCSPPPFGAEPLLTCQNPGPVSRWDGTAEIVLPTADKPEIGVYAGVQNGMFSYAGGQASHLGNAVHIAAGVYLDNVALAVCVTPPPLAFKGAAGIHIGPVTNGKAPVTINGSLEFRDTNPWVIEARGNVEVLGERVAEGFFRYRSDKTIDFGFRLNINLKVASLEAALNGWIEARNQLRFNVDGSGKVCLAGKACISGEVTASSVGIAGCVTLVDFNYPAIVKNGDWAWYAPWRVHTETRRFTLRGGIGYRWGGSASLMGDSCDVGPYRAARTAQATAVGVYKVLVPPNTPALTLEAQGLLRAPGVVLISPNGTRYTSPNSAAKIVPLREIFAKDSANRTTAVMIANPQAGTWTVQGLPGSIVTAVRPATITRPLTLTAGVGGSGFKRVLSYSYQAEPLHSTRFVEDGASYEQELGAAAGKPCPPSPGDTMHPRCGEIHFTPAPGPAGVRNIYAITTMNGEITNKELVATYRVGTEPEPSIVPNLTLRRIGTSVTITWKGSTTTDPNAKPMDYNVDVNLSDGRELVDVTPNSDHTVTIVNVAPQTSVQVSVAPVRQDDTEGRIRTLSLGPGVGSV
ncbi:MAG: fibronectin type III domain-containing protein [Solirubrobacterales bacterium]|nr:fibronectin type III domain-containing protein [Solirubrobacterales bacterium]